MVGWPDDAGRHYPGRGTAHRVDHVDCARGGGDNPTIVVVDARSADMSVDLDTGTSLDYHAVNSRSAVRRELPIRSGRLGEPVDMFHRDHHIVAPHHIDSRIPGSNKIGVCSGKVPKPKVTPVNSASSYEA